MGGGAGWVTRGVWVHSWVPLVYSSDLDFDVLRTAFTFCSRSLHALFLSSLYALFRLVVAYVTSIIHAMILQDMADRSRIFRVRHLSPVHDRYAASQCRL